MNRLDMAIRFATAAHSGQTRKYTGEPYVTHPIAVADIVRTVPHTENMLIAAVLHDTVEDTSVTHDDISVNFGFAVALKVWFLTDVSTPDMGNRDARKLVDAIHVSKAPADVQTIKVADLIHNSLCISANDPGFWNVYKHEKRRVLDMLSDADPMLWEQADELLKKHW